MFAYSLRHLPTRSFLGVLIFTLAHAGALRAEDCSPSSPCVTSPVDLGTFGGVASFPRGLSADGSVVTGYAQTASGYYHAFRWQGGTLQDLGTLGGPQSYGWAVSADGSTIVGYAFTDNTNYHAVRWVGTTIQDLGTLGGSKSDASSVSANGSVVAGSSFISGDAYEHAFRWDAAHGMVDLLTLGGDVSYATHISADGSVVVGYSETSSGQSHAFRWFDGTMTDLGTLGGVGSTASAVSRDGSVVVGSANTSAGEKHAVRWSGTSIDDLGTFGGTLSESSATNYDGSVVVGYAYTTGNAAQHAFRWESGSKQDLGTLGGTNSYATRVDASGDVVVGYSQIGDASNHAFRWTSATGIQDLNTLLSGAGVNMTGIVLTDARYVSANGQFITGLGSFAAGKHTYVVRYFDGTGGLTSAESVQQSVNGLDGARAGAMAQQHGLAMPLLGDDKPMSENSEAGVFGQVGSGQGGGYARFVNSAGLAVITGVSYGYENYDSAAIKNALTGALAVRYLVPGKASWRPFAEAGGWYAPEADFEFERTYANGAGTATGFGKTEGDVSYLFARAGVLYALGAGQQLVISGEAGRERLALKGYAETFSQSNPFEATVTQGTDTMTLAKARVQWSAVLGYGFDATLWGAGVYGFNRDSGLQASVIGIGTLTPLIDDGILWAEYGGRIGYALTSAATLDVFVNGVSGEEGVDTRVHGGAGLRYRF